MEAASFSPARFTIAGMSPLLFALLLAAVVVGAASGTLPVGLAGILPLLMVVGAALDELGGRLPGIKHYLGGGPVVAIFGAAALTWLVPDLARLGAAVTTFMKAGGFLDFYISALIAGSILGMERRFLLRAGLRYLPVLVGAVVGALLLAGLGGWLSGFGVRRAWLLVAVPIMGGGMGAGAIPLAEILAPVLGGDAKDVLSRMVPAVALANALAIVLAGALGRLGSRYPQWGDGTQLIRGGGTERIAAPDPKSDLGDLGTGLMIAGACFVVGRILGLWIPVHPYAIMIVGVTLLKATHLVPSHYERCAAAWFQFVMRNFTHALLVGIGVAYTDLGAVVAALTPGFVIVVSLTVGGAAAGAAAAGRWLGFFPIEASITGGLCMANMGGTGDVAVLSASRRMALMPFAQISSRLGGALIILLASLLAGIFG